MQATRIHPYAWLWEPASSDPTFVLRPMFGARAMYLSGRLMLCFVARREPFRGVLVATERDHHPALMKEFPALEPHPILPKWLYLRDTSAGFERIAERLVRLAQARDPRVGVIPPPRRRRRARGDHP